VNKKKLQSKIYQSRYDCKFIGLKGFQNEFILKDLNYHFKELNQSK